MITLPKRAPTQDSPELQCSLHNLMGIHIRRGVKRVSPLSLLASRPEISNLAIISISNLAIISISNLAIISPTSILSNLRNVEFGDNLNIKFGDNLNIKFGDNLANFDS